jgi:hypothetical protein
MKLQSENLEVELNEEVSSVIINGEPELIKKCFENILENAITYSHLAVK